MEDMENVNKLVDYFTELNIVSNIQRCHINVCDKLCSVFVISFQNITDAKYLIWNVLENVPEDYFSEGCIKYMTGLLSHNTTGELAFVETDFNKLVAVVESLIEKEVLNEWQSSKEAISKFYEMVEKCKISPNELSWSKKYHAIRHLDIWEAPDIKSKTHYTVEALTALGVECVITFEIFQHPYLAKFVFTNADKGINFIRKIRTHSKFKNLDDLYMCGLEQASTEVPREDHCVSILFNLDNFNVFSEIVEDVT